MQSDDREKLAGQLFSRRTFLKTIAAGSVLLGALGGYLTASGAVRRWLKTGTQSADASGLGVTELRQLITADNGTSRCIMWRMEEAESEMQLEYRLQGSEDICGFRPADESFTDDGVKVQQYAALLTGLQPGKTYEYRLVAGHRESAWHKLRTDAGGNFQALIFPDSQSSDYSDWRALVEGAAERHPEADFFVNMGDLVDNGEDYHQWEDWFAGAASLTDSIPFVPVMGNHETYDQQWKVRLPEAHLHYFDVPENGSANFSKYYYSFDYGPVHFAVLNTQWDEIDDFRPGLLAEQQAWLKKDMQGSGRPWKIVLMHKDVLQYRIHNRPERQEGISDTGSAFMPLFEQLGVDVVFSAHLHTYRNRGRIKGDAHDSRGPLYILTGVAGNVRYPGLWIDHALDEKVAPQPETDNYLTMAVDRSRLEIACYLPDGTEIDRVVSTKA